MFTLKIFDKRKLKTDPFFIAEVGQNHQGDFDLAKRYIEEFSRLGATAVKFQMRDNRSLFSTQKYNSLYNSENAFAATYGEHREALELSANQLFDLKNVAHNNNCLFMVTPFDEISLLKLVEMDIDIFKIASFDLGNLSFIRKICAANKPTVLSVGGGSIDHISASVEVLSHLEDHAILHCVSQYPCPADKLNLQQISILQKMFKTSVIGLSDHFSGISNGPISYMLGARVFEKHVTFSRAWKGTDHPFSLLPEGFRKFVRDIRQTPRMLTDTDQSDLGNESVFQKLGKKIVASRDMKKGERINETDLTFIITDSDGLSVRSAYMLIGKHVTQKISKGELINKMKIANF